MTSALALALLPLVVVQACTTTVVESVEAPALPDANADFDAPTRDGASPESGDLDGGADRGDANGRADARDGGDTSNRDAAVDCGAVAAGRVFSSPLGPFCPFQAGSTFSNCAVGEHCCEYAEEDDIPSTCSPGQTACLPAIANGFDWRCDESNDCPLGQVCCFAGAIGNHPQCAGHFSASPDVHSTACRVGTCATGETRTCGSNADCPTGTQCTGMRLRGKHFGFCK